jgi:hypothetical protein
MNRLEFAARLVLIYAAGILGAVGAKGDIAAPFAIASIFLTAELAMRAPGRDGVDRFTRVFGSVIVALILGGFVLNFFPEGLTRQTWSALWVVISLAVLWWKRREVTSFAWLHKKASMQTAWFATAAVVVIGASVLATHGANQNLQRPLQMWVQGKSPGSITVAVSSGSASGPYKLVVDPEVTKTDAFDAFTLTADSAVERSIPAGPSTRYRIHLVDAETGEHVRTVIVVSPPFS